MKLTKKFRFEAAHRLAKGYVGKCQSLHGHSWNGHIECEGDELSQTDMIIDFSVLGQFVDEIEQLFDHATIVADDDTSLIRFLEEHKSRHVTIAGNPTCERLAMDIFERAKLFFNDHPTITVSAIEIQETCTTSCRYEGERIKRSSE